MTTVARPACRPLYATQRSPDRPTLGPRVAAVAQALGKPLMPHQRAIVDTALEIDPGTGYLAYGEVVVIGPRQVTGKTELILPVLTHRCTGFEPALTEWVRAELGHVLPPPGAQQVLYVAQNTDTSRQKWRDVHLARLAESPFGPLFTSRLSLNQEAMFWRNGSTWKPGSTTAKRAGTGDTLDLAVIDEAWSREDNRTELGLRPAMLTRPWSQLWVMSMVPGPSRKAPHEWPYLKAKILGGRQRVESGQRSGVFYAEFAAAEGLDPGDPDTWWSSMPGLGYTTQERKVREDFAALGRADFEAEYLGWLPVSSSPRWSVVAEQTWEALYDPHSSPVDPIALGVAANDARSVTTITLCARRADGDLHTEIVDRRPGVDWAEDRVVALVEQWGACAVAVRPNGPAASLLVPLRNRLAMAGYDVQVMTPNEREYAAACGRWHDATGEVSTEPLLDEDGVELPRGTVRLRHLQQGEMDAALANVSRRWVGRTWSWCPAGAVEVSPVESSTLAMWAGQRLDWAGGSYDVMESLG